MTIKLVTTHVLSFQVIQYWATEGGMESQSFGEKVSELVDAIRNLELARDAYPTEDKQTADWIIECRVETRTGQEK